MSVTKLIIELLVPFLIILPCTSCEWTGAWIEGGQIDAPSNLTLYQSGNIIEGTYTHKNGVVHGEVSGNILTGIWAEDSISGPFKFTMSKDCNSFNGTYTIYGNSTPARSWNGTRVANAPSNGNSSDPYMLKPQAKGGGYKSK